MQLLEERILKDGIVKPGNVLKVDSFLNHQMDIAFINELGKEFQRRFADAPITKILTIESHLEKPCRFFLIDGSFCWRIPDFSKISARNWQNI